jgi:hypothetical protein
VADLAAELYYALGAKVVVPAARLVAKEDGTRETVRGVDVGESIRPEWDRTGEWRTAAAVRATDCVVASATWPVA